MSLVLVSSQTSIESGGTLGVDASSMVMGATVFLSIMQGQGDITLNPAGWGRARADVRIILEGVRTTVFQQRTKEANYVVWQRQINQGSNTETLTLPSFTGTINTPFRAPGGITVQIPAGEFRSQIATLSQQPGMAFLNELAARSDVNWQPVKLAHDQWNYKQEGLTPAGAALVAVAVAMLAQLCNCSLS